MRFAHVTYCDDVRQEVGGKTTFVGIYNGVLGSAEFPCLLPKLCMIVQLATPREREFAHIVITGRYAGEVIFSMDLPKEDIDKVQAAAIAMNAEGKFSSLQLMAIMSPFQIPAPGKLTLEVIADGEQIYCPGLRVELGEGPQ